MEPKLTTKLYHKKSHNSFDTIHETNEPKTDNANQSRSALLWRERVYNELLKAGMFDEAVAFSNCGRDFQVDVCISSVSHAPKAIPFSCHLRACPECEHREVARKLARYVPAIYDMMLLGKDGYSLKKFELTTPYPLKSLTNEKFKEVFGLVEKFIDSLFFDILKGLGVLSKGELKRGRADLKKHGIGVLVLSEFGHKSKKLHFHAIAYSPFIPKHKLTDTWREVTGGECEITWIKKIALDEVEDSVKEVVKYVTKFDTLEPKFVPVLLKVLKGNRRVRAYGVMHGIKKEEAAEAPSCPICGSNRRLVAFSSYIQRCMDSSVAVDDSILERAEALHLLDLRHGNNSGEPFPIDTFKTHTVENGSSSAGGLSANHGLESAHNPQGLCMVPDRAGMVGVSAGGLGKGTVTNFEKGNVSGGRSANPVEPIERGNTIPAMPSRDYPNTSSWLEANGWQRVQRLRDVDGTVAAADKGTPS